MNSQTLPDLKKFIFELTVASGMNRTNAEIFTDIYIRATLRGVGHHDVYDLPGRISAFHEKIINPDPQINLISSFGALESYDGNNGPGELCCSHILNRSIELAKKHGIGLSTIKNSNHFLSAAPYVEKGSEQGFFTMIFSKTNPVMGFSGMPKKIIGNCPMGFSAPTVDEAPLLLDICLAYASYGALDAKAKSGESVASHWGTDASGNPATDPAKIMNNGVPYAIGGHKGFGLALFTEILTGVLSGGQLLGEPNTQFKKGSGIYSQTAIAIKVDAMAPAKEFDNRVSTLVERLNAHAPGIHIPGQSSYKNKKRILADGKILLDPHLIDKLNALATTLGVDPLK